MAKKRGRPKKIEHTFVGMYIKVKCHSTDEEVMIEVSVHDFHASDSECELCGSHGEISVDYKCPVCGQHHEYELQSW